MHDKELGACAVRILRARHRNRAAGMFDRVFYSIGGELAFNRLIRAAHSGTFRVAALNHKAGDDAVKCQAIVKSFLNKFGKICHRDRGLVGIQFHFNRSIIFDCDLGVVLAAQFSLDSTATGCLCRFLCGFLCRFGRIRTFVCRSCGATSGKTECRRYYGGYQVSYDFFHFIYFLSFL